MMAQRPHNDRSERGEDCSKLQPYIAVGLSPAECPIRSRLGLNRTCGTGSAARGPKEKEARSALGCSIASVGSAASPAAVSAPALCSAQCGRESACQLQRRAEERTESAIAASKTAFITRRPPRRDVG